MGNMEGSISEIKDVVLYIADDLKELKEDVKGIKRDVDVLKEDVKILKQETKEIREDVNALKQETKEIREDVNALKQETKELKEDVKGIKQELKEFKQETREKFKVVDENSKRITKLELMNENEIIPKLDLIYESYSDMNKKFDEAIKTTNTYNFIEFKVNNLKNDYEDTKQQLIDNGYIVSH